MAELIDKKAITESRDILDSLELFELTPYISAENLIKFVDNLSSVTEADIRAKAIDEFAEKIMENAYGYEHMQWSNDTMISIWESTIDEIAEQLKGE